MARKITDEDLANRGVMGLPDVPGLTAIEMQKKLEEIPREVIIPRYNELVDSVTSICDEFSKLNSYAVGDYCIYQNKLYKCNTATNGDWDASKWTETSVGDELKSVNSNLHKDYKSIGTSTDLSVGSYTFESDGYITWNMYQSGHGFSAALNNNIGISQSYDGTQNAGAIFALKGMTLNVTTKTGGSLVFYPIIYKE